MDEPLTKHAQGLRYIMDYPVFDGEGQIITDQVFVVRRQRCCTNPAEPFCTGHMEFIDAELEWCNHFCTKCDHKEFIEIDKYPCIAFIVIEDYDGPPRVLHTIYIGDK